MKIAIICAMEEERSSIISCLNLKTNQDIHKNFIVDIAKHNDHEIYISLCGIGKVNAAITSQFIIDKYNPEYIVNVGVAGALCKALNYGDIVIASDLIQHDMDVSAFGLELGQIPRMEVFSFASATNLVNVFKNYKQKEFKTVIGRIASGDKFVNDQTLAQKINENFAAIACDMEAAAIAQACYINNVDCLIVRAISDYAGQMAEDAASSFIKLKQMASNRAATIIKRLLEIIC